MDIAKLKTDPNAENNGVWETYKDAEFLIGSVNSAHYKRTYQEVLDRIKEKRRRAQLTADEVEAIQIEVYSKAILLGWRNIQSSGTELVYSAENAALILKSCPEIRDYVFSIANDNEFFRVERLELAKEALGEH